MSQDASSALPSSQPTNIPASASAVERPDAAGTGPPPDARLHWLAAALLVLHATLAWPLRAVSITTRLDDATYLALARSLLHLGYNDTFLVGSPVHSQYPPGYPALLAVLMAVAGERLDLFAAVNIALSALALGLFYDMVRRRWPAHVALLALAAAAVNPFLIITAGRIASESLFMALAMLALWALSRTPASGRLLAVAGAAALLSALARSVGVTIIAAVALYWLYERRYRPVLVLSGIVGATVGAWLLWTVRAPASGARSYVNDFSQRSEDAHSLVGEFALRAFDNAKDYFAHGLPWIVWPSVSGTAIDNAVWLLLDVGLGAIGAWLLWRRHRIVALALLSYCTLLAIWTYPVTRFLYPILPLIFVAFFSAATWLGAASRIRQAVFLSFALGAIIIGAGLWRSAAFIDLALACDRDRPMTSAGCFDPDQRAVLAAAMFAKRELPATAVVIAGKDAPFGYLSGLKTYPFQIAWVVDSAVYHRFLLSEGIEYVLAGHTVARYESLLRAKLLGICESLELVAHFPPRTNLLRVHPGVAPDGGAAACEALRHSTASQKYEFPGSGQFEF